MARMTYVGLPAHGHTNPALPVLRELKQRGHQVIAYNADYFREKMASTGADFRALPNMPSERRISEVVHSPVDASVMFSELSSPLTHFMIDQLERERPDLLIYDSIAMWGYIAARVTQLPQVCFISHFVLDGSLLAIGLGQLARFYGSVLPFIPKLLAWRRSLVREFGAENAEGVTAYADLNIVFTSQAFHPENRFVDERFRFVGPAIDAQTRKGDFPFDQLTEGEKVYISLGTINHLDLSFYEAVFAAFADFPAQFILSAGKNTDLAAIGQPPANFIVRNVVPQLAILQHVDGFISHGGINSVQESLLYGVPLLVVPHHFEQLLNAKRVAQEGAGLLLGGRYPYGRVTPQQLRRALEGVLTTATYRQNAERVGQTLKSAGGTQRAADEIESYLKKKMGAVVPA
ncbi:MAG: glycosyl transferase [Chloroflexi bacterium]|nr:glycosyl transferase [Chloroflexota bacterium]